MPTPNASELTLYDTIHQTLVEHGFGATTSEHAAKYAAEAAATFYYEPGRIELEAVAAAGVAGTLTLDDGISQGISRLAFLTVLSDLDAGDVSDSRIESRGVAMVEFPYRGHRVQVNLLDRAGRTEATVSMTHSLPAGGARMAQWKLVGDTYNVATAVPVLRDIDAVIDAERAEVFA
jgi:hypothetical protein